MISLCIYRDSAWKMLARKILGETFLEWGWLPLVELPCDRLGAVEKSNILRRLPCCERAMRVESYRVPPLLAPLAIVGLPSCYLSYPSLLFYTRAQPSYKHTFRSSDMLLFFPLSLSLFLFSFGQIIYGQLGTVVFQDKPIQLIWEACHLIRVWFSYPLFLSTKSS